MGWGGCPFVAIAAESPGVAGRGAVRVVMLAGGVHDRGAPVMELADQVRKATPDDLPQLSSALSKAFFDDPRPWWVATVDP